MNEEVRKYMSSLGKRSAAKLTPAERKQRAREAAYKRWERRDALKKSS